MGQEKPRLIRLTAIITQLQSKRIITARAIAERHGVSIRTVYRDIRTLQDSGIPIVMQEGRGYSIMEGYKLPPVMFTEKEALALITAEHLIKKNKDASLTDNYESAITKIKSVLQQSQKSKTELVSDRIQIRNNIQEEKSSNYLIELQTAIANFIVLQLTYVSLQGLKSRRDIEPFAVYTTKDNWVLIAFCRLKQDFRAFRLDRIVALLPTALHFQPHKITLEQYLESCREKW